MAGWKPVQESGPSVDVQGVSLSVSTASSADVQGVSLSPACCMDVQCVSIYTIISVEVQSVSIFAVAVWTCRVYHSLSTASNI
jgi:hypothetical protein